MNAKLSRREFLKLINLTAQAALLGLLGYGYSAELEIGWVEITNITLKLRRLDPAFSGMRLVQISDFHLGQWLDQKHLERAIEMALEQKPDYVILTGDYIEYRPYKRPNEWTTYEESLKIIRESFPALSSYCPTLAILGNHDHRINADWVEESLSDAGIEVMRNSVHTIRRGASQLHIAAVDDVIEGVDRLDLTLDALPKEGAAILLVHEPDFADVSAATGRFDLQLSGHSHGGQIVLPLIGAPILPTLGKKYPGGLYNINNMFLYTNRGIGVTTINARFNCRPEITVFTLEPA